MTPKVGDRFYSVREHRSIEVVGFEPDGRVVCRRVTTAGLANRSRLKLSTLAAHWIAGHAETCKDCAGLGRVEREHRWIDCYACSGSGFSAVRALRVPEREVQG